MPQFIFGFPLLMSSGNQALDYGELVLQALILLVLLIIVSRLVEISRNLKNRSSNSDLQNTATAFGAGTPSTHQLQLANDMPSDLTDDELVAVLTAAIQAYEADTYTSASVSDQQAITSNVSATTSASNNVNEWNAPTTAGFRIKSIKRVS